MQIFFRTRLVKHLWPHITLHLFRMQNLFRYRHIGCTPKKAKLVQNEIDEMLKMGIVSPSDSPWASPIVIVPKLDGSIRLCVDYRHVEVLVDKLVQANYLTKVDTGKSR